jgi:hypothetical protein
MSTTEKLDKQIEQEIDTIIDSSTMSINTETQEQDQLQDNNTELDEESTQAFNISLQQYLSIDREKCALLDSVKQRTGLQKNYEQSMLSYLNHFNIKNVALEGSYKNKIIEMENKSVSTGFTRSMVVEVLTEVIGSDSELFDTIMIKLQERVKQKDVQKLKLIDLAKKKITKREKNKQNNIQIDTILNTTDTVIPDNMKYLYENNIDNQNS